MAIGMPVAYLGHAASSDLGRGRLTDPDVLLP
jgi:hypothetical protein